MRKKFFAAVVTLFLLPLFLTGCTKPNLAGHTPYVAEQGGSVEEPYVPPAATTTTAPILDVGTALEDYDILPEKAPTTRNRYLLVGLNTYPGAGLQGCVNDVHSMAAFCKEMLGAKDEEIVILTNGQGTAKNIKKWLGWLVADARPNDKRLYHFSGHGAEFDGGGGPVVGAQPDGLNQVQCTIDFDWTAPHMIQDWELNVIFSRVGEGVICCVLSDSCHSGNLDRVIPPPGVISMTARSYPNIPPEIKARLEAKRSARAVYKPNKLHAAFVSGCDYNQTSADVRDQTGAYGAATHYFIDQVRKNPTASLKDNIIACRKTMKANQFDQVLQYAGLNVDQPFMK